MISSIPARLVKQIFVRRCAVISRVRRTRSAFDSHPRVLLFKRNASSPSLTESTQTLVTKTSLRTSSTGELEFKSELKIYPPHITTANINSGYKMPPKKLPAAEQIELPNVLPELPVPVGDFLKYIDQNPGVPVRELLKPYLEYETVLRAYFAQESDHEFVQGNVNLISLFEGENSDLMKIRARNLAEESKEEKERYIMPLDDEERKSSGERILVGSLKEFKDNFNIFSEGSLLNMDWSNVIAAGSSVLTPLLKVPKKHAENKKTLREYYHQNLAPASDIDLFIHGIEDPEEAIKKIAQIEETIKNNLLWETTTLRTRNTVTIVSQYPNRHVQIVLRLYKSPSQILTGFDVNCSCFAYDGTSVLSNPRALASCMTQCNDIDLTRRSPSYENRLSKYSHRGFEVYCDFLDRTRIDPTIFERSFTRTVGLARLLVLEALPKPEDRDSYVAQRRTEMGRPEKVSRGRNVDYRDIKQRVNDEVAEWDFEDTSGYQKFSIPYGQDYNAKRIEKLFFKKDLLLNAEWNPMNNPPNREVNLHRHPVFFGGVEDVVGDCCGFCPKPANEEEQKVWEEEEKIYVSGPITFLHDDPGRQEIGSFYPLGPEDYMDMAYVGSTEMLCEAIVENNIDYVKNWVAQEKVDVNRRDFCGRTPLQLACISSGTDIRIVQTLVDAGARLVARLQDGRTALHVAAAAGRVDIVNVLLERSAKNEAERDEREERKSKKDQATGKGDEKTIPPIKEKKDDDGDQAMEEANEEPGGAEEAPKEGTEDGSYDQMSDAESEGAKTNTTRGFVKVSKGKADEVDVLDGEEEDDDIYEINIIDWDNGMSPLHHAIIRGHEDVVEALVSTHGADCLLPMKIYQHSHYEGIKKPSNAILNLVLALRLKNAEKRAGMAGSLLKLGASSAQANSFNSMSAFHYAVLAGSMEVLDKMFELDGPGARSVMENIADAHKDEWYGRLNATPLVASLMQSKEMVDYILDHGVKGTTSIESFVHVFNKDERQYSGEKQKIIFGYSVKQPIEVAIMYEYTCDVISRLIKAGADISTVTQDTFRQSRWEEELPLKGKTIIEMVRGKIEKCEKFLSKEKEKPKEWKERVIFGPEVLDQFEEGSYRRNCAEHHLAYENKSRREHNESKPKKTDKEEIATEKKRAAVEKLLKSLKETEGALLAAGAKTYHELFPEKKKALAKEIAEKEDIAYQKALQDFEEQSQRRLEASENAEKNDEVDKDNIFTVPHFFNVPYLGKGPVQDGYLRLFEAIWRGTPEDANIVKELTLGPSGEGENRLPALRISVYDSFERSTLWVALHNRNWEMAKLILGIVQEQYKGPEGDTTGKRFMIDLGKGYNDSDSDDEIRSTEGEVAFTIENIGVRDELTKCDVSPFSFLTGETMSMANLIGEEFTEKLSTGVLGTFYSSRKWSLLSWAIYNDDMELIRFLFKLAAETKEDGVAEFVGEVHLLHHARLALTLGRIEILEEIMKTVPFGIPFAELMESDEEFQLQKPKFYQGLTVYGVKRKDWASSSYPAYGTDSDKQHKAIQIAVYYGQLDSIKWLLSERPFECLKQFMEAHPDNIKTKLLKKQGDGVGFMLQKGLGVETTLLPHLAIVGWFEKYPMETFRFLLSRPGALEARSNNSMNLALYAVEHASRSLTYLPALEELLKPEYDVDFLARDGKGRNVLHLALVPHTPGMYCGSKPDQDHLETVLKILPKEVHETGWTQRMLGTGRTPLAEWLNSTSYQGLDIPSLRTILRYSKGRELGIPDGGGNLPIHWAYLRGYDGALVIIANMAPQYINCENANGRTPLEIATSQYLLNIINNPLSPPNNMSHDSVVDQSLHEFYPVEEEKKGKAVLLAIRDSGDKMEVDSDEKKALEGGGEASDDGVVWAVDFADVEKTYQLAITYAEKYPSKRKLVSLNDANELAKRITSGANREVMFDGGDILSLWAEYSG